MKDNDFIFTVTPRNEGKTAYYKRFMEIYRPKPIWIGIDWAIASGMSRGDIINRHENVVHVRFKTVTIEET